MTACPCGSGREFDSCCGRYISGEPAPDPASLMRARYSAFTRGDLDFIEQTCTEEGKESLDRFEMERSLPKTKFHGFEVRDTRENADEGTGSVTFAFRYRFQEKDFSQVEIANFKRVGGLWLFNDSIVNPKPATIRVESIGRNEPCPCGSGKKYKKCCGASA